MVTKQCIVMNLGNTTWQTTKVAHHFGDDIVNLGEKSNVEPGEFFSFDITTGSLLVDDWTIWLTADDGATKLYRQRYKWDVGEADASHRQPLYVLLYRKVKGFTIQLPVGTSCVGAHYW